MGRGPRRAGCADDPAPGQLEAVGHAGVDAAGDVSRVGLAGPPAGRVPAAILLGILAQESNLWQASWHALEGVTGNPLIGNFYGIDSTAPTSTAGHSTGTTPTAATAWRR